MSEPKKILGLAHRDKLILFGLKKDKPQAAIFEDTDAVRAAAPINELQIVRVRSEEAMALASRLA